MNRKQLGFVPHDADSEASRRTCDWRTEHLHQLSRYRRAILSGWLLQTTGGYEAPMMAIFFFLVVGAVTCIVLLHPEWSPKVVTIEVKAGARP